MVCKRDLGFSYSTVMRRIQILKGHADYLRRRDEVGDNGCYGREYATYLARPEKPTSWQRVRVRRELRSYAKRPLPIQIICS